jgi:hypothetical protein
MHDGRLAPAGVGDEGEKVAGVVRVEDQILRGRRQRIIEGIERVLLT